MTVARTRATLISAAIDAATFGANDANGATTYQSDAGVGFQGLVGKEWAVSDTWGLGMAPEFIGASMKDKDDASLKWSASAVNLLFSATYF